MGYVINPISNRLGLNTFWHANWSLNNKFNYTRLHKQNLFLFSFLNWALTSSVFTKRYIRFTHYSLYQTPNGEIFINAYFYWPQFLSSGKQPRRILPFFRRKRFKRKQIYRFRKIYRKIYKYNTRLLLPQFYWYCLNGLMNRYLGNTSKLKIRFYKVNFDNITPRVISTYIVHRLIQRHSLRFILRPILRDLTIRLKQQKIQGYKILCAGRFTRRQIAERNWYKQGAVSNNNFSNVIAYDQTKVRLKYGTCGIKIWLNFGNPKRGFSRQGYKLKYPTFQFMSYYLTAQKLYFQTVSWSYALLQWHASRLDSQSYSSYLLYRLKRVINKSYRRQLFRELTLLKKRSPKRAKLHRLKLIHQSSLFTFFYSQTNLILSSHTNFCKHTSKKHFYYE